MSLLATYIIVRVRADSGVLYSVCAIPIATPTATYARIRTT